MVSYAGIVVLRPSLPHNTAFVDPLLAVVSFGALLSMGRQGSPATVAAVKALPWIWLIIVGSLVGLATVGLAFWGVSDLLVSLFAFLTFFAFWHLVYLHHMERYAVWGTAVGLAVTTFTVVSSNRLRSQGSVRPAQLPGSLRRAGRHRAGVRLPPSVGQGAGHRGPADHHQGDGIVRRRSPWSWPSWPCWVGGP